MHRFYYDWKILKEKTKKLRKILSFINSRLELKIYSSRVGTWRLFVKESKKLEESTLKLA